MHDPQQNAHILVVEDNRVNCLLIKNILSKFHYRHVDTAENGKAALDCILKCKYDIILMDVQMPEMDGHELTRTIRKLSNGVSKIPIIAITADASEKERKKAAEAGMNDYIAKPYSPVELMDAIRKYLGKEKEIMVSAPVAIHHEPSGTSYEHLDKYTGGDVGLTIKLIDIFLLQVSECIDEIEKGLSANDWPTIYRSSHKIKSSLAVFKLEELKEYILPIEEHSRDLSQLHDIPGLFEKFRQSCSFILNDLRKEAETLKAQKN